MVDTTPQSPAPTAPEVRPWPALFALCLGFFMILVDTTIVTVATPAIMSDLDADVNSVVWVTSAYLLAYAVPVLITGRLGDRFGPKRIYLIGLVVFTLASLWCGLTNSVEMLIVARVVQGLGAALMTPQTMAVITRIFPSDRRGQAMALWGATAGVATLVGPILGGVLVDTLGWEWIFFINVPVGVVGFVLAWRLVPTLETHSHRFDWLGVALSGLGMFALVFGIQEGHQYDWGQITGIVSVWGLIILGLVLLGLFVWWQAVNRNEPLVPLSLFTDRNFSISNFAISTMSFTATSMGFPLMLYAQLVRGLSPTEAALLLVPMAAVSIVMAPIVGRFTDRVHPRVLTGFGFALHRGGAPVAVAGHDARLRDLGDPAADGPPRLRHGRRLGAARRHRHPQPPAADGGRRRRRLQRDAPGRRRARLGRDRGADGQPAGRPGPGRRRLPARSPPGRSPRRSTSRSARPWRSRCCCPPRCSCSAWCRCCSSCCRGTSRRRRRPPRRPPRRLPRHPDPRRARRAPAVTRCYGA